MLMAGANFREGATPEVQLLRIPLPRTRVNKAVLLHAAHYAAWSSTASLALVTSYKVSQRYHDDEHLLSEPHCSQAYASTRPN